MPGQVVDLEGGESAGEVPGQALEAPQLGSPVLDDDNPNAEHGQMLPVPSMNGRWRDARRNQVISGRKPPYRRYISSVSFSAR